jgi:hypothetical protein
MDKYKNHKPLAMDNKPILEEDSEIALVETKDKRDLQ